MKEYRYDRQEGPTTTDVNWVRVLQHHAERTPDQVLAAFGGRRATYADMVRSARRAAAGLQARDIGPGDVVALLSYNNIETLTVQFAANYLGAIVMPLNWRLAAAELEFILGHAEARVLVCDLDLIELADAATACMGELVRIAISAEDIEGWERFDRLDDAAGPARYRPAAESDVQRLMYTSGTTGRPKGVMITHANLAWKNYAHVAEFGFTAADVGLACGPMYHVGALDLVITTLISVGATVVVHKVFDAAAVVDEVERSAVTLIWLAPAMVRAIIDLPGIADRDLSSVRVIIGGGEKMPIPVLERAQQVFSSAWLADAYGLTETVSGDTFLDRHSLTTKLGSVGKTCLYVELDIQDEAGTSLPPGSSGEIVLRGPKVFSGYWRDEEATARAFAGGWFHTGDIGVRDDDGYVYIVDRLKDMIVSGGENIAGSEVERVLYEHSAVVEVAVVGRPHERWGEVPVAFVVARASVPVTAEELIAHCRTQLAKFKVPTAVWFVEALPRNASGKVLKKELRRQL